VSTPSWAQTWHLLTVIIPAAIDHRPTRLWKEWPRSARRHWIYKKFIEHAHVAMNDQRLIGRTKIAKGALLFFSEKTGVHSCTVRDITNRGAGIRAPNLKIVPVNFALSFDSFRAVHMCCLIWRQGEFLGVVFENCDTASWGGI
jgi:hypothetical protein